MKGQEPATIFEFFNDYKIPVNIWVSASSSKIDAWERKIEKTFTSVMA
jgi:hypothetical protein